MTDLDEQDVERRVRTLLDARSLSVRAGVPDPAFARAEARSMGLRRRSRLPRLPSRRVAAVIAAVATVAAVAAVVVVVRIDRRAAGTEPATSPGKSVITDPAALVDVSWRLTRIVDPARQVAATPSADLTFEFSPSGDVHDNGGDSSAAVLSRRDIRFTQPGWVNGAVAGLPHLDLSQSNFAYGLLTGAVGWSIVKSTLTLFAPGRGRLVFIRTTPPPTLPTCGRVPVSAGPFASRLRVILHAPAQARSGSTIHMTMGLRHTPMAPNIIDLPQSPNRLEPVVVVQNGYIVGKYRGGIAGNGWPLGSSIAHLPVRPLLLSGCPSGPIDYANPDASRHPLPPGHYQLVGEFLIDKHTFLASDTLPITVTN
jgi:hypothetical protein